MNALFSQLRRLPVIEILLIIGLPMAIMIAGVRLTMTAMTEGFTPIAQTTVAPKGH